jgi:tRNA pseudouridine55 synthase
LNGALILDKPEGRSSAEVLDDIKWLLRRSGGYRRADLPKFGHGGTLDPFATGVLMVLIGHGTRFAEDHLYGEKTYEGILKLGQQTDTGDITGEIVAEKESKVDFSILKQESPFFCEGVYEQIPPMYSAKSHDGKRLYKLARKGKVVERDPISCKINLFELKETDIENEICFQVRCSAGTFIRVLGEDLAKRCGTFGHLKSLKRVKSGDKNVARSISWSDLKSLIESGESLTTTPAFVSLEELLQDTFSWECPDDGFPLLKHGNSKLLRLAQGEWLAADKRVVITYKGEILAVAEREDLDSRWRFRCVLIGG